MFKLYRETKNIHISTKFSAEQWTAAKNVVGTLVYTVINGCAIEFFSKVYKKNENITFNLIYYYYFWILFIHMICLIYFCYFRIIL